MTEATKRSLRVRRPPAYFGADSEDPEQIGYAKQTYAKELVSPAQQMNNLAKLMSKFVNSVNKHLKQASKNSEVEVKGTKVINEPVSQKPQKKNDPVSQEPKKKISQKVQVNDGLRKPKDLYSYKDQMQHQEGAKNGPKTSEANAKEQLKQKQQNFINPFNDMLGAQYLNYLNQINSTQQMATMSNLQISLANQAILQQQQMLINSNPFFRPQYLPMQPSTQIKQNPSKEKLFGRAAFHVAIAYHIHLKKIKQSGVDITAQSMLDPTYHAKKLRGDHHERENGCDGNL